MKNDYQDMENSRASEALAVAIKVITDEFIHQYRIGSEENKLSEVSMAVADFKNMQVFNGKEYQIQISLVSKNSPWKIPSSRIRFYDDAKRVYKEYTPLALSGGCSCGNCDNH